MTNRLPDVPCLSLEIKGNTTLSTTLPYPIDFTITHSEKDDKPCIVRWSPETNCFTDSGLLLAHRDPETNILEKIPVDHTTGLVKLPGNDDTLEVTEWSPNLWELTPGTKITIRSTLPERYYKALAKASNTEEYELVWCGGEIVLWGWGTIRENLGQKLKTRPKLLLLGGSTAHRIPFTRKVEEDHWPGRETCLSTSGFSVANIQEQEWRSRRRQAIEGAFLAVNKGDIVPGAPILKVTLEGPQTVVDGQEVEITVRVSYMGVGESGSTRPITFHTHPFTDSGGLYDGYHLYCRRNKSSTWEEFDDDGCGYFFADEPNVPLRVHEHRDFVTLHPGETWVTARQLPLDKNGCRSQRRDVFRYEFKGTPKVDWWDWGTKEEDHKETIVQVPSWITGPVVDPCDNGNRPQLVVPSSNVVEFEVV